MAISKSLLAGDPAHLRAAFGDLGLKETPGPVSHDRIRDMFAKSGNPGNWDDSATAWCAAAMGAWLIESGHKGSGKLTARSYLEWGTATETPKRGDIVVFKRGDSTWQGHVALYLGADKGRIWVIGGNQANAVTAASYPAVNLLGYRRVPAAVSAPVPQPEPKEAPVPGILKSGAKGAAVTILQRNLAALGFDAGPVDGEFGPATTKAVKAFQLKHGLDPDGEVGPLTNAMLAIKLKPAAVASQSPGAPKVAVAAPSAPKGGLAVAGVILAALLIAGAAMAFLVWGQ